MASMCSHAAAARSVARYMPHRAEVPLAYSVCSTNRRSTAFLLRCLTASGSIARISCRSRWRSWASVHRGASGSSSATMARAVSGSTSDNSEVIMLTLARSSRPPASASCRAGSVSIAAIAADNSCPAP